VTGIEGSFNLSTVNSGIEVDWIKTDGRDCSLTTTNGSLSLTVPTDLAANIDVTTTNGEIETELPITVEGKIGSKRLHGRINGGGQHLTLKTTNGSIRILKR
jgi:DUF4097 and DUF4098 domain-containing protein YvlB